MRSSPEFTRRDVLKVLGTGAALLAAGGGTRVLADEGGLFHHDEAPKTPPPQPFVLPPLPFAYDALEPTIDGQTMEVHLTRHHQAYIDAANRVLAPYPQLQKFTADQLLAGQGSVPEAIRLAVRNQVGGHANHCLWWKQLSPMPSHEPGNALGKAIEGAFGSLDAFKMRMTDLGMKCFGSGWVWLSAKTSGDLIVHIGANEDSPLVFGVRPLLGIDVWEHAYYLKHQWRRYEYLQKIWQVIDWKAVDGRYADVLAAAQTPAPPPLAVQQAPSQS